MKYAAVLALCLVGAVASAQTDVHGVQPDHMDKTATPGSDWFRYANGAYLARTEIPADRTGYSSFSTLADVVNKRVAAIIGDAAKSGAAEGTEKRKIADLYASYENAGMIEAAGLTPLKPELAAIDSVKTRGELAVALGGTLRADVDALNNTNFHTANLFGVWVAPGFNDPDHYAVYLLQGGLQLPSRDYYLTDNAKMKAVREAYGSHIATIFRLAGYAEPEARAAGVMRLETAIAQKQISLAESEDISKADNVWQMGDFATKAPGMDWAGYFKAAQLGGQASFIVWQPTAVTADAALVGSEPIEDWKNYLVFHTIESYAGPFRRLQVGALPKAFEDEYFDFYGKTLTGATEQRPRDQRALQVVNNVLGDAVGQLYAQVYFPAADKAKVEVMVHNLLTAFHARLEAVTWMAPATKAEALKKLGTLQVGIGYADHWRTYAGLEIKPDDLFGNIRRYEAFEYRYNLERIGKPVDRKEWVMTPQTVNAVNLPLDNGLNFPAAIFGQPFFDAKAPDAVNYGAIGTIIGHEISHTFDSEGASFDSQGKVRNWWTDADRAHFDASIEALAKQYDSYAPFPDLHLNGHQTLGENIADLAGLTAAHDAWLASLKGKPAPEVDGMSGEQQFFLGYAQSEAGKSREAALRQQVLTDPHSPSEYRADTVRNLDAWYPAFAVKDGQTLYLAPEMRVHIW